ncbi:MAG: helix-turn-helix domain-containing protein [Proteobacteria bacterium]|nr:helix-turn-helix domain-containing protein [Pseudomonadota bacterium]
MAAGSRGKRDTESTTERTTPGAHLRAVLKRLGLDQVAVSKATGVSRQSVNNIINGRQPISRAMAGKLGRLTGHSSDYWLSEGFGRKRTPKRLAAAAPLVNHEIASAVRKGVIAIEPFVAGRLRCASIDLTLGDEVVIGPDTINLAGKEFVSLKPGCALRATTAETIELPYDYLGRFGAVARLTTCCVILSGDLHVEPGFKGPVRFILFNAGHATFQLRPGETIGTLEVLPLSTTAKPGPVTVVSSKI